MSRATVDQRWVDAFILELRLQDVPGEHIGAALAEVESHCAESGEGPREAFGDPGDYARSLAAAQPHRIHGPASAVPAVLASLAGLSGMFLALAVVDAWRASAAIDLTTGDLAVLALALAGSVLLGRYVDPVLTLVVRHTVLAWVLSLVPAALFVGVYLLLREPVLELAWPVGALLAVVLLAGSVLVLRRGVDPDPIRSPWAVRDKEEGRRGARILGALNVFLFPVLTVLLIGVELVLVSLA